MPNDDGPLKIWNGVPDRATLELSLTTVAPAVAGSVRFVSDDGRVETWPDSAIHPGPKRRLLSQTAVGYVATVLVGFDNPDEVAAQIRARIVGPDNTSVNGDFFHEVRGQRGDIEHATLLISMVHP